MKTGKTDATTLRKPPEALSAIHLLHPDDREPTREFWTDSVAGRRSYVLRTRRLASAEATTERSPDLVVERARGARPLLRGMEKRDRGG